MALKIIPLSLNPSQQVQEVTRCGGYPVLGYLVGLGRHTSSTGEKCLVLEDLWAYGNGAEVLLPTGLRLTYFVPFPWTETPIEAPCICGNGWQINISMIGNLEHLCPSAQKSPWNARSWEQGHMCSILLMRESYSIICLQSREKEELVCIGRIPDRPGTVGCSSLTFPLITCHLGDGALRLCHRPAPWPSANRVTF